MRAAFHVLRRGLGTLCALALLHGSALAQESSFARITADAEVSIRTSVARDGAPQTMLMIDSVETVRAFAGLTIVSRPMLLHRIGGTWDAHLAQFTLRHDTMRRGVGVRIEGGLLPSPVGLAPFTARASTNATITPATPFGRGVTVEPGAPVLMLYPLTYPVGVIGSLSAARWDARAGLLDSTPLRVRWPLERHQPKMTPNLLAGGGWTPRAGLRLGGWLTAGNWATASEVATAPGRSRYASTGGLEVEYAIAWTKLAGEWAASRVSTASGREVPTMWMLEASQALAPRWFVAGRLRRADFRSARVGGAASLIGTNLSSNVAYQDVLDLTREAVVGYRMSPSITWRAGYIGTRPFGVSSWAHRAEASLVFAYKPH